MTHRLVLLVFFFAFSNSISALKDSDIPTSIAWPNTSYHLKGEELDLKTGLTAPFEIWSSKLDPWIYRRDHYGGVQKEYYDFDRRTKYNIFPMTNEETLNEYQCIEMDVTAEDMYQEDVFLPDLSSAIYTGTTSFEDKEVQIWESEEELYNSKMTMKAYVSKHDTYSVPVQITTIVYDMDKGYVESHTVTKYYDFSEEFDMDSLNVTLEDLNCGTEEMFWQKHPDMNKLDPKKQNHVHLAFRRFMSQNKRSYDKNEMNKRKAIFHKNWKMVVEHNSQNLSYKLEMNKYADRTPEELGFLAATRWNSNPVPGALPFPHTDEELEQMALDLPEELDLHLDGMITPVKNQHSCGSCWAFATVAAVEGALALRNGGRTLDLSEQSLVDCAWGFEGEGCDGGTADGGLKYVLAHGVPTDEDYGPYIAKNGLCGVYNMTRLYKITGFGQVVPRNPTSMKVALNRYGPVVVGVHASQKMKMYSSGVFYDIQCVAEEANHAVTVVGYGVRDGELYWLVKNSWGEDWGEGGYILLSANNNNCLLLDTAYYPVA